VKFPNVEAGIPEGYESIETLPSMCLLDNFFIAIDLLQKPIKEFLEKMEPFPTCIICDKNIITLKTPYRVLFL
jgi:UDP-glucosyl transferase 73C